MAGSGESAAASGVNRRLTREELVPLVWDACKNWMHINIVGVDMTRVMFYDLIQQVNINLREAPDA